MSQPKPERKPWTVWRVCRVGFRCVRIVAWLLVLAVLVAFIWFNQVGVPGFVKRPVLAELKARGFNLEFQRLRWLWFRGLVAEGISVEKSGETAGPLFTAAEAEVSLDHEALRNFQFLVRGVALRQGELTWTVVSSNRPPRTLTVTHLATSLRFLPDDVWELPQLTATVQGLQMKVSAIVTNATALHQRPPKPATPAAQPKLGAEALLHQVLTELARVQFASPPEIELTLRGDAKLERGLQADLKVKASDVRTPWGGGRNASFTAKILQPPAPTAPSAPTSASKPNVCAPRRISTSAPSACSSPRGSTASPRARTTGTRHGKSRCATASRRGPRLQRSASPARPPRARSLPTSCAPASHCTQPR